MRLPSPSPAAARRALHARAGGLPRPFWAVFAATAVNRLGGLLEPFIALYMVSRGFSIAEAGAITALTGAGSFAGQLLGGVAADRLGRREAYLLGMTLAAASFAVLGAADATWLIVLAAFAAGCFLDFYRPASGALINDLLDGEARTRAFGLLFWVVNAGFALAATVAGALAEQGFTLLFVIDGVTCVLAGVIVYAGVARDTRPAWHDERAGSLADVLRDRRMLAFCGVVLLNAAAYLQAFSTLPLAMGQDGHGPGTFGAVIALNGVIIVVLQPLLLPRLARRDPWRVLIAGIVLVGLGYALMGLTGDVLAYALPLVVWTVGEVLFNTVSPGIVADMAPAHLRGRYQGVYGTSFSLALVVAPLGGGLLLDHGGDRVLWTAVAGLCVASALGARALSPRAT